MLARKNQILKLIGSVATITLLIACSSINAKEQLNVSREAVLKANPETVWKMIGNFNHLDVWHPVVVDSKLTGSGETRVLTLGNGANITEKLLAHSDDKMSYTYAIMESPLPVKEYVSTISVDRTNEGSIVKWTSTFNASDVTDEKAIEVISGIYEAGLGALSHHFNQ